MWTRYTKTRKNYSFIFQKSVSVPISELLDFSVPEFMREKLTIVVCF